MRNEREIRKAYERVTELIYSKINHPTGEGRLNQRRRKLWNYEFWDLKRRTKSHTPTAYKLLRWVLGEEKGAGRGEEGH